MNDLLKDMQLIESLASDSEFKNLQETSLGRVFELTKKPDIAIAFFSGMRSFIEDEDGNKVPVSKQENRARNEQLKKLIIKNGWGFSMVKGAWKDSVTEEIQTENSFFVSVKGENEANKLKGFVRKLTKSSSGSRRDGGNPEQGSFDQDAVVFKPIGKENAYLITNEGDEFSIGKFSANAIADNFTKIKNSSFTFKEDKAYEYVQQNYFGFLKDKYGK